MAFPRNKSTLAHRSGEVPAPTNSPQKPTNRLSELPETQDSGSPFPKASPLTRYASRHIDVTRDDSTRHICCAVVNREAIRTNFPTEVNDLAAALKPFTKPTPQPERYTVSESDETWGWVVSDNQLHNAKGVAHFEIEQDAKDFAAMKNTQEANQ